MTGSLRRVRQQQGPAPLHERREWIGRLSDEELEYLASYHRACFAQKMAAKGGCAAMKERR